MDSGHHLCHTANVVTHMHVLPITEFNLMTNENVMCDIKIA